MNDETVQPPPKVLLVGLGSEIGSRLLLLNHPEQDGWAITHILTRKPGGDSNYPELGPAHHLVARLAVAEPSSVSDIDVSDDEESLIIRGRSIKLIWGDVEEEDFSSWGQWFDLVILATSQKHVNMPQVVARMEQLGRIVYGLAENATLPAVYPVFQVSEGTKLDYSQWIPSEELRGTYAAGSCQTHGWLGQAVPLVQFASEDLGLNHSESLVRAEVDIIHPDTPTGMLGTHGFSARQQDARDNLRPSFSQLGDAMVRLWPSAEGVNTVSLRTLLQPPGYQISRTYLRVPKQVAHRITWERLATWLEAFSDQYPLVTQVSKIPLGSRAYSETSTAAVVLLNRHHLRVADISRLMGGSSDHRLFQVLTQAYVHNTRGYCAGIQQAITSMLDPQRKIHIVASE